MKVFWDECCPFVAGWQPIGHVVLTAQALGWKGKKNGELLRLVVKAGFAVFVTSDKNLKHQQNLKATGLAFLQLPANDLPTIKALLPQIEQTLARIKPGDYTEL